MRRAAFIECSAQGDFSSKRNFSASGDLSALDAGFGDLVERVAEAVSPGPPHIPFTHTHSISLNARAPVFGLALYTDQDGKDYLISSCGKAGTLELWDLTFFSRKAELQGHRHQVTALAVDSVNRKLFSAARDGIKVWDLVKRECISTEASLRGTMYCLAVIDGWLFGGGQDTMIHVFGPDGAKVTSLSGHRGFVYAVCPWGNDHFFSGGGDAVVLLWKRSDIDPAIWTVVKQLEGHTGAVVNLALGQGALHSVSRDGSMKVWDLETFMLARSLVLRSQEELLAVAVVSGYAFAGSTHGTVSAWIKPAYTFSGSLRGINSKVVSLLSSNAMLFVGGSDGDVSVWQQDMTIMQASAPSPKMQKFPSLSASEALPALLSQFVSYRTVSGDAAHRVDCFNGAKWLRNCFVALGFDARLEQPENENINPILYARLGDNPSLKTIVIYGHYDVVPAGPGWDSDPWVLKGLNGYLYGRGATDDKGPMLAAMLAASILVARGELKCNIRFLIEGEEENGSTGILESVVRNKSYLTPASILLISNNYWLGERRPCLTYGLRGVIYFVISVTGPKKSNHSGVDGGVYREPMMDLMHVMSSIQDPVTGRVLVDKFYDDVRPVTDEERVLYEDIDFDLGRYSTRRGLEDIISTSQSPTELLMQRWRFPSLSVTSVETPSTGPSIIPSRAVARMSIRTVPDQDHSRIIALCTDHLEKAFAKLGTKNTISVQVERQGAWWLGDLKQNPFFKTTEMALEKVWGQRPSYIREGGSIPIMSRLEKELQTQGLILPLGQSLDNAHLPNERVSLEGLTRGVEVFKEIFMT